MALGIGDVVFDCADRERVIPEAELARLGVRGLERHEGGGEPWTVMTDPQGNELCIS